MRRVPSNCGVARLSGARYFPVMSESLSKSNTVIAGIVLAAGKGTRMKSDLPKVLHKAAGLPMLDWVVRSLQAAGIDRQIVVISPGMAASGRDAWRRFPSAVFCVQKTARGTGDAVASAYPALQGTKKPGFANAELLEDEGNPIQAMQPDEVIICAGDTPAITGQALSKFVAACRASGADLGVLAMRVADPTGYGRILTSADGNFVAIVEERDASPEQRKINSCNSGVIFAKAASLFGLMDELHPNNSQGEYYLTDCLGLAVQKNLKVVVHGCDDWQDFLGVNDRSQLAAVEKILVRRMIDSLMKSGVTFHNPESCHIEADCKVGVDSEIGSGVCLEGRTVIGRGCKVGSNVTLDDVELGDGAVIGAGSVVRNYVVNPGESIPPLSMIQ